MKNNYVYSITITHYNNPEFLSRMLRSIPERDDIQVIVVDDGSPDRSGEIAEEFAAQFPCIQVIHQTNAGVAAAI